MFRVIFALLSLFLLIQPGWGDWLGRLCGTQWGEKAHLYPVDGVQVQQCIDYCHNKSFQYAGLIFGRECFCDNTLPYPVCRPGNTSTLCLDSLCNSTGMPCLADPTMICGDTAWYSLYDSGELHNDIWHWDTDVTKVCAGPQLSSNCSWNCAISEHTYEYDRGQLIGTEVYGIQSSYCLAAAHDLRFLPNNRAEVILERSLGSEELEGSWRHGINSAWGNQETFRVISPNRTYNYSNSLLYGFADLSARLVRCQMQSPEAGQYQPFLVSLDGLLHSQPESGSVVPDNTILICGLNRTDNEQRFQASFAPVVVQPTNQSSIIQTPTLIVLQNEPVSFSFNVTLLGTAGPLEVRKEGESINATISASSVDVYRANTTSVYEGFYQLIQTEEPVTVLGNVEVVVVPNTTDYSACGEFQGLPREDGTCLCLPPFGNGTDCSQVCNPDKLDGTFGPNCDLTCGGESFLNCKGQLICSERPFGCHCSSGWTGPNCDSPCSNGTFGLDCLGHASGCYCIGGEGCSVISGLCPFGCDWGYYTDACNRTGPFMKRAPYIISDQHANYILVGWKAWNQTTDGGSLGESPDEYYLEFKLANEPDSAYSNITNVPFSAGLSNYSYNATALEFEAVYAFRVRTSYAGLIQPIPSPPVNGSTVCEAPTGAPQDLLIVAGLRNFTLTWKFPSNSTWECYKTYIHCDTTCLYKCDTSFQTNHFDQSSDEVTMRIIEVPAYSSCNLSCYLTNKGVGHGPEINLTAGSALNGPPAAVRNFSAYSAGTGLVLIWNVPWGDDGRISYYEIEIVDRTNFSESQNVSPTTTDSYFDKSAITDARVTAMNVTDNYFIFNNAKNHHSYVITVTPVDADGVGTPLTTLVSYQLPHITSTGLPPVTTIFTSSQMPQGSCDDDPYFIAMIVCACLAGLLLLALIIVSCLFVRWVTKCDSIAITTDSSDMMAYGTYGKRTSAPQFDRPDPRYNSGFEQKYYREKQI